MSKIECKLKTAQDCWSCGKYRSSHSEHFSKIHKQKVSEVSCNIGGNRVFDKNGKRID